MMATAPRTRCRDCGRRLRRPGTWGIANVSGWCAPCRRRHRCCGCGQLFPRRVPGLCARCVRALRGAHDGRHRRGECHTRPPGWEERLDALAERAARGLPVTG